MPWSAPHGLPDGSRNGIAHDVSRRDFPEILPVVPEPFLGEMNLQKPCCVGQRHEDTRFGIRRRGIPEYALAEAFEAPPAEVRDRRSRRPGV